MDNFDISKEFCSELEKWWSYGPPGLQKPEIFFLFNILTMDFYRETESLNILLLYLTSSKTQSIFLSFNRFFTWIFVDRNVLAWNHWHVLHRILSNQNNFHVKQYLKMAMSNWQESERFHAWPHFLWRGVNKLVFGVNCTTFYQVALSLWTKFLI